MIYNSNDVFIGKSLNSYGEFAEKEIDLFKKFVKSGDHVVDIGANIGTHSLALSKLVGLQGIVMSYEPQRILYYMLCGNVAINNLKNIYCLQQIVGDQSGLFPIPEIDYNFTTNAGNFSILRDRPEGTNKCTVRAITLDEIEFKKLNFIKIDVEGMEENVLRGAKKNINKFRPFLYIDASKGIPPFLKSLKYKYLLHTVNLYNPDNFINSKCNVFGNILQKNLFCYPEEISLNFNPEEFDLVETEEVKEGYEKLEFANNFLASHLLQMGNIHSKSYYNHDKAIECLTDALKYAENPEQIYDIYTTLANTHARKLDFKNAIAWIQKAIEMVGESRDLLYCLGVFLAGDMRLEESCEAYEQSINCCIDNGLPAAHWNLGWNSLLLGNYKRGFKEYEYRFKIDEGRGKALQNRYPDKEYWDGGDLSGKRILLFIEQGFGDLIHFVRYAPMLKKYRNAKEVIIECWPEEKLLISSCEGVDHVVTRNRSNLEMNYEIDIFDISCSIASMPFMFNTDSDSIPKISKPYLKSIYSKIDFDWGKYKDQVKVGICWAGSKGHNSDFIRSVPLKYFMRFKRENVQLFSLHKGTNSRIWQDVGEVNLLEGASMEGIVDMEPYLNDFNDTANILEQMDLIITVDTAIAHLAGALCKPVWTIVSFSPDWRWLTQGATTDWYPTMKIFRQPYYYQWEEVFREVNDALNQFLL